MQLNSAINNSFSQLKETLEQLTEREYSQPSKILFNASIGQHVRHIIELYICLYNGYETGVVNYEKRKRDIRIETDKDLATELMDMICNNIDKGNKSLLLDSSYDEQSTESIGVETNYYRELIYNLEHTVHHMALIRVGINEVSSINIPEGFGVATSTIKYRRSCAQ
ncbi:MAG: hypothetical protein ABI741_06705 [Ferruginibacter sp.]